MFRVEHTGGMSLGSPILRNDNITFAKFTLNRFSYTSQYYKLPSHKMTRVSVITSKLKRGRERPGRRGGIREIWDIRSKGLPGYPPTRKLQTNANWYIF